MERLNFSWLEEYEVAGHAEPRNKEDLAWLFGKGVRGLVRMSASPGVTHEDVTAMGFDDLYEPVPDFKAPSQSQLERMTSSMLESAWQGKPVGVSCGAGIGRTGTVLACYLAARNMTAKGIILRVRRKRAGAVETDGQINAVEEFIHRTVRSTVNGETNRDSEVLKCLDRIADEFESEYGRGFYHARTVTALALNLYEGIANLRLMPVFPSDSILLRAAGYLHVIGSSLGDAHHNVKGFDLLTQRLNQIDVRDLLSESEIAVVLYAVLWLRGNDFDVRPEVQIEAPERQRAKFLTSLLRISEGLCFPGGCPTARLGIHRQNRTLVVEAYPSRTGDSLYEQVTRAMEKKDLLENLLKEKTDAGIWTVDVRKCVLPGC